MLVVFLLITSLLSAVATSVIVFKGVQSPERKTTQTRASKPWSTPTERPASSPISTPTVIPSPTATPKPLPTPLRVVISPYLTATSSSDKKSLFLNFANLQETKSATYKVTYSTDQGQKGAEGNIVFTTGEQTSNRKIIFGVCSGESCTYDGGVKNIKIVVTFTQKDGTASQITYPYTL